MDAVRPRRQRPRRSPEGAIGRALARHRRMGARRAFAPAGRRLDERGHQPRHRGPRRGGRRADRRDRRLLRRLGRSRGLRVPRRAARLSGALLRHGDDRGLRAVEVRRGVRARPQLPAIGRPRGAGNGALGSRARVRRCLARDGQRRALHAAAPRAAQLHRPRDGVGDDALRLGAARRELALLPGARRAAARALVGRDALRRAPVRGDLDLARDRARTLHLAGTPGREPPGRCGPRPARPADEEPVTSDASILSIRGLTVSVAKGEGVRATVVDAVDLDVAPGEIVALVGESGSGKTMIGRSILRLLPPVARIDAGEVRFEGVDLVRAPEPELRRIRGARIGMVFQEPMVSLNPALRVGYQMAEALRLHGRLTAREIRGRSIAMLERVKIVDPERCLDCHPHEFSGGMRQRIMLASVFATHPRLLVADEPTTALDAIIQKEVMETLVELAAESGTAVLLVSHDLGMVAQYARRVAVMRRGVVVETGETRDVLLAPRHEYTRALLEALPRRDEAAPAAEAGAPLFEVRGLRVDFPGKPRWFWQRAPRVCAVDGVDLDVRSGETLAVVGESGSGKTTIGRALVRLLRESAGYVRFDGRELGGLDRRALLDFRLQTQMVFQDPYSSLDPRMTLLAIVAEGLRHVPGLDAAERGRRARRMLAEVGLEGDYAGRLPHELSGGQRQRVCIARAIVARPRFVVADEPVSALDVTTQKQELHLSVGVGSW